ncbi:hypothetical protein DAI22_01g178500 [Oryza sativa Japonica Group]|nr:hypothetical protein DAI22_01g178500 [Oryza sativa Japonica Group]
MDYMYIILAKNACIYCGFSHLFSLLFHAFKRASGHLVLCGCSAHDYFYKYVNHVCVSLHLMLDVD